MLEALLDAFIDSLKVLPLLFLVYLGFELIERRSEGTITRILSSSSKAGPFFGALFGSVPQCGFSVMATALWAHGSISPGTLLAVYLSTSDEAIPILLAQPQSAHYIAPILLIKIATAVLAGYLVDLLFSSSALLNNSHKKHTHKADCHCHEDLHCCGDPHLTGSPWWMEFALKPLYHAFRVFLFIFAVSWVLNLSLLAIGQQRLLSVLASHPQAQTLAAILVGLIPNCAASVAITQLFILGGLSLGSAVAGLSASTGLGLIVLFKEAHSQKQALIIVGLLAAISYLAGTAVNAFF